MLKPPTTSETPDSLPPPSTGRRRMRYYAACAWHVEARFGFGLPPGPLGPFIPLIGPVSSSRLWVGRVGRRVTVIGALFGLRCPVVIVVRWNGDAPLQRNR